MDMRIPARDTKILLESNPPKSRIVVRRLGVIEKNTTKNYTFQNNKHSINKDV